MIYGPSARGCGFDGKFKEMADRLTQIKLTIRMCIDSREEMRPFWYKQYTRLIQEVYDITNA